MKRKIGITAFIFAGIFVILFAAGISKSVMGAGILCVLMYAACMITGIICLFGDFIRFIGRMFSKGYNEGAQKSHSRYCPYCGRGLEEDACFCPGCGTNLK